MVKTLSPKEIDQRRADLIDAALNILETDGVSSMTLRRLAQAAGVSRQTPYLYFKDKAALIDAMCVAGMKQLTSAAELAVRQAADAGAIEQLRMAGETYVRFGLQRPALYALIFNPAQLRAKLTPAMADAVAENNAVSRSLMQQAWDDGRVALEPERLNMVFWASLHGLISLHNDGLICDEEEFSQVLQDLEFILARGFLTEPKN